MNKLSGNKNTDMLILMNLNDSELGKVCSVNKYINSICEDKHFWNMRVRLLLNVAEEDLHELRRYLNLEDKDLYVYLVSRERIGWKYTDLLILFLLKYQDFLNEVIKESVIETLPKYINKEELIYYLRGKIPKIILEDKISTIYMDPRFKSVSFYSQTLKIQTAIKDMRFLYSSDMISFLDKYIKENIRKKI